AQIFPLANGYDFRVKLSSVGFLQADKDGKLFVSQTVAFDKVYSQTVLSGRPETLRLDQPLPDSSDPNLTPKTLVVYPTDPNLDVKVYAQKHHDGYTYVAGMLRTDKPNAQYIVSGMHKVYWTRSIYGSDGTVKLFIGRR